MARLVQGGDLPYQAQASEGLSEYLVALGERAHPTHRLKPVATGNLLKQV